MQPFYYVYRKSPLSKNGKFLKVFKSNDAGSAIAKASSLISDGYQRPDILVIETTEYQDIITADPRGQVVQWGA